MMKQEENAVESSPDQDIVAESQVDNSRRTFSKPPVQRC